MVQTVKDAWTSVKQHFACQKQPSFDCFHINSLCWDVRRWPQAHHAMTWLPAEISGPASTTSAHQKHFSEHRSMSPP